MNKKTLIRGESLSINILLKFNGTPITGIADSLTANAWFQNNTRINLIVTELGEGYYNLYSKVDTKKLKGHSFLVNLIYKYTDSNIIQMATYNETFYIVNSATVLYRSSDDPDPEPEPPSPTTHTVTYYVDGQVYTTQQVETGARVELIDFPVKTGYNFVGWDVPDFTLIMPDEDISIYGEFYYSGDLAYTDIDENTCAVSGRGTCIDTDIKVPPLHNGKTVVKVAAGFLYYDHDVISCAIPDTVTEIGQEAFRHCINMTSLYIPDTVEKIGKWFCWDCTLLEDVSLPASLELERTVYDNDVLRQCWFQYCSSLEEINFPDGMWFLPYRTFRGCTSLYFPRMPVNNVRGFGEYCLIMCNIGKLTLDSNVTVLNAHAFDETTINEVVLDQTINNVLFGGAKINSLTASVLGQSNFDSNNLSNTGYIKSITLKNTLLEIPNYCFRGSFQGLPSEGISSITINIPTNVASIGKQAFAMLGECDLVLNFSGNPVAFNDDSFSNNANATITINYDGSKTGWNSVAGNSYGATNIVWNDISQ